MSKSSKDLVRRFAEVGNSGDWEAFTDLLTADFVRHCEATPEVNVTSCEDFKQFYRDTAATFPDQHMHIDMLVAEGDLVAFWGTFTGTQQGPMGPFPPTGKPMQVDISGVFRIESGRITEEWVTWDNLAAFAQLGLLPATD